jgi:hypothetical protein
VSGTDVTIKYDEALERLEAVLDRRTINEPLTTLSEAVHDRPKRPASLGKVAFGFDSSVFMRLATHRRSADILDYLLRHDAPLILPGQTIQEFWNNQLSAMETVGTSLKKRFDALAAEAKKVDEQFGEFEKQMTDMLAVFQTQYGYIYDGDTKNSVAKMLSILQDRAFCAFVPRTRFNNLAQIRKRTRTPPGFKDSGDGDFFVWADFLFSMLTCGFDSTSGHFDHIVLLTNDRKADWSTNGTPHPVLTAEVDALFGVPFDLWDLETFSDAVSGVL